MSGFVVKRIWIGSHRRQTVENIRGRTPICHALMSLATVLGQSLVQKGLCLCAVAGFQILGWCGGAWSSDLEATTPNWTFPDAFILPVDDGGADGWPQVRPEARPGAYWWWPGGAVTKEDLTWNLETYRRAGWGNLGVVGIYGVRGEEERFLNIFSPEWFAMFNHAVAEGKRLGVNIDVTPSAGWRLGGPHVTPEYGEQVFSVTDGKIVAKHNGARVKLAGPGGTGLCVNPYSKAAVTFHFDWIGQRFTEGNGASPRAFYYDSFENPGNWCPEFLESFRCLRGYELEQHANALANEGDSSEIRRVICDYRETLSDILIDRVNQIVAWCNDRGSGLRMQAHGAPANLLDMYAAAEIPETEVFGASLFDIPGYRRDPELVTGDRTSSLVNRFASSAAHVAGRNVVISESFTWLRNHFHTTLAHCKAESDRLLLNGINCIYYHGICFAPKKTEWPGWLFYASTQGNARNSIFRDIPALNAYITRVQSVLQEGQPGNDVLLYWPVYDRWMADGKVDFRFSVHWPEWLIESECGAAGQWMIDHGFTFDFVSDRQLKSLQPDEKLIRTTSGSSYRTVLVPAASYMKLETLRQLISMAKSGATILVWRKMPGDVPGFYEADERREQLRNLISELRIDSRGVAAVGDGKFVVGDELAELLAGAGIKREPMTDNGLQFIRRRSEDATSYFIVNHTAQTVDSWVPIATECKSAVMMDPMTGKSGLACTKTKDREVHVRLQMQPGETRILRVLNRAIKDGPVWAVKQRIGKKVPVTGTWHVEMTEGGPVLPQAYSTTELVSWTERDDEEAKRFAGAARYRIAIDVPNESVDGWILNLGDVRESARVWVNAEPAGIVVAHPFQVDLHGLLKPGKNELTIEVTNLSANRIRDLDIRGVAWKKFHDINIVSQLYKPFDASKWPLKPSGLLGPVTLQAYRQEVQ